MDKSLRRKLGKHQTRISAPELTFSPEQSHFRVAEWIYSHEETCEPGEGSLETKTEEISRPKSSLQAARLPSPYLVNREASEQRSGTRLIKALRSNPMAFYYYKKRRLFKPHSHKSHTSQFRASPERPVTRMKRPAVSTVRENHRVRVVPAQSEKCEFFTRLFEKCRQVQPSTSIKLRTFRERESLRRSQERLDWTQKTLEGVSDCEPDLLIPYYLEQKEARESLNWEVRRTAEELKQFSVPPSVGVSKFERVLRRNKNLLL